MSSNTRPERDSSNVRPAPRWLKVTKNKKKDKSPDPEWQTDPTRAAIVIAGLGAACGFYSALIVQDALTKSGTVILPWLPPWRAHMAIACVAITAFVISLFFLEVLNRRSKYKAMKSSLPWLSLVVVSGAATAIHIPIYIVIVGSSVCCLWAYRCTRAVA